MQVTSSQLRAARALLDWSQEDLAEKTHVALDSINKFENGRTTTLQAKTAKALLAVLDPYIEFQGTRGVALRDDFLTTLDGETCYLDFLDLLIQQVRGKETDVLFFCVDDTRSPPEVVEANTRLRTLTRCRYICEHSTPRLDYPPQDYRAIPSRYFRNGLQVIYLDRVATLVDEQPKVLIVRNATLADTQRALFELVWNTYPIPNSARDAANE